MPHFEVVKFSEAYNFAWFTWSHLVEPSTDDDGNDHMDLLNPREQQVAARLSRPHRDTLLHLFLRRLYSAAYIEAFEHHRNDMLDLVVDEYETILTLNEVPFKPFALPAEMAPDFERVALRRIAYLEMSCVV